MSINVLGALSTDAGALSPQERAVVAALAVNPGHEVRAGELAEACWGDTVPRTWPKQVQALVSRVRRRLGSQSILTTTQGYALGVATETIDSVRFQRLVDRARGHQGEGDPERAITGYEQALALWRGPPFSDVAAWPPASVEAARLDEIRRAIEEDLLEAHLDCGEHHSVIAEAEGLVRAEPLSERRWSILALALYRSGRQADALAALRRLRDELGSRLGVDPGLEISALETEILRQDPRINPPPAPRAARAGNPYKGLRPFTPDDAADFFGRDPEITEVLDRLDEAHLVTVVGPSGSGKSSLVLAGVVPRLRDRGRGPVLITPGTGRRTGDVVIIDQFEELFQLGWPPDEIAAYCESVAQVVATGHDVILTLRSDALDRCVADPLLGPLVREGLVVLGPPSAEALRLAIEEPARYSGLRVEHGLTELILRDAVGELGVLPHLSHALAETWRRREGAVLTVEAYESVGGISGAIARSAEELYAGLSPEERIQCQALLRRLVSLTPDGRTVQRRVLVGPLRADAHRSAIITRLVDARLVSVAGATITVAHESLATAWPRLHSWLEEDAEGARTLARLTAAAESWDESGRPADELYRGARLRTALEWRNASSPDLTGTESDFLDLSAEREFAEEHRAAEDARRELRQTRLRRILLTSAAVFVVASIAATILAVRGAGDAARQRESADIEDIVGTSLALRSSQRAVAALLAVEAHTRWPDDPRPRTALMGTFTSSPGLLRTSTIPDTERFVAHPIPGTDEAVVVRDDGTAAIYDIETARPIRDLAITPSTVAFTARPFVEVSADGGTAVVVRYVVPGSASYQPGVSEFLAVDLASGDPIGPPVRLSVAANRVAVDSTGSFAAVAGRDGRLRAIDLESMQVSRIEYPVAARDWTRGAGAASVAFLDDDRLAIGSTDAVGIVDLRTNVPGPRFALPSGFANSAIAQAGSTLIAAGDSGVIALDMTSGALRWSHEIDRWPSACTTLSVSTTPGAVWCGNEAGDVLQYDLATGASTAPLPQRAAGVFPGPDGSELVIVGTDEPVLSRWAVDGRGAITRVIARGSTTVGGYGSDGSSVLVTDGSSRVHVWDPRSDSSRLVLPDGAVGPVWAGVDSLLVNLDGGTELALLDATTGEVLPSEIPDQSSTGLTWTSGRRVMVVADGYLWVLDPITGERLTGPFQLNSRLGPTSVSPLSDGSRLLVTTWSNDGVFTTRILDTDRGEFAAAQLVGPEITTVVGDAVVVGAEGTRLLTYAIDDFAVIGSLPSTAAGTRTLQASVDGRTLLATGIDGSASVYDLASGLRLGDAIPTAGGEGFAASLRPDGRELAVVRSDGLQLWDLDTESQVEAACRIAGRDLTREEWEEHLGAIAPYRSTCGFGSAGG
ncbi:PQQ-binding-like beta-propeller repeat protein [Streptomyces sp. ISL-90]|nr:PQQ-binding-like beta-propeller repeat protein [Streptomyces sp. ISL-90]